MHSKGDRAKLVEFRDSLRELMNDAQFTMAVDSKEAIDQTHRALDAAPIRPRSDPAAEAKEDALRKRILDQVGGVADETAALSNFLRRAMRP